MSFDCVLNFKMQHTILRYNHCAETTLQSEMHHHNMQINVIVNIVIGYHDQSSLFHSTTISILVACIQTAQMVATINRKHFGIQLCNCLRAPKIYTAMFIYSVSNCNSVVCNVRCIFLGVNIDAIHKPDVRIHYI